MSTKILQGKGSLGVLKGLKFFYYILQNTSIIFYKMLFRAFSLYVHLFTTCNEEIFL